MQIKIAEIVAIVVILLSAGIGALRGLVMMVYSLVRMVLLLVLSVLLVPLLLPLMPEDFVVPEGAAFVAAFILSAVVLAVIAHLLKIVDHIPVLKTVNKLGGFIAGAVLGAVLVWLALFVIGSFEEASWCQTAASYVRESSILSEIQKINPITYMQQR